MTILHDHKTTLYIGSPNDTHSMTDDYRRKIVAWAERVAEGHTLIEAFGSWNGVREQTAIVIFLTEHPIHNKDIRELRVRLKQSAILVTRETIDTELV